jgi:hypothetical protein
MPPAPNRLAIDLSGSLVRVLEGTLGGTMQCGSAGLPDGAMAGGKVANPAIVGQTLKQLLARTDITDARALVAVSDALATFRVLNLSAAATDQDVGAAIARDLPLDPERIATRWIDVGAAGEPRMVYAVAWDRTLLKAVTDALKVAGVDPIVVELKSASVARTVIDPSCVVLDLTSDPAEIVLIDRNVPHLWHTFDLELAMANEAASALAGPLRSVLRYFMRGRAANFRPTFPILVSGEQMLPSHVLSELSGLLEQPVRPMPAPARVSPSVRHPTYLTCLGLLMRRSM